MGDCDENREIVLESPNHGLHGMGNPISLLRQRCRGIAGARAIGFDPCTATELKTTGSELSDGTPLWLYVLAEAEAQHKGEYLGEVGGRIVAEVIFELLRHDPDSILNQTSWTPELADSDDEFGISDLLTLAGVA
jgi:hypothetical protein